MEYASTHCKCKLAIKSDEILVKEWFDLLNEAPGIDDSNENVIEVFTAVLLDLYEMMTDYFIKIALSNGLDQCSDLDMSVDFLKFFYCTLGN
jgi:hypothetical protein